LNLTCTGEGYKDTIVICLFHGSTLLCFEKNYVVVEEIMTKGEKASLGRVGEDLADNER
jgi:hypothetical protein